MAISITKADVKRKCAIVSADTTYDTDIDNLISEMQPAVEYTVADIYLADTSNTSLQATLKLGILEIISGEFLEQLCRELGASEEFSVGSVTIGERKERGQALMLQGAARLAPYLKTAQTSESSAEIRCSAPADRQCTISERIW